MTLQGAKLVSFCETLPSRRPDRRPRPRLPTTRRSGFSRRMVSMIISAGSPHPDCNLMADTPLRRARFRAWSRILFAAVSNVSVRSPSALASRLRSSPEMFPPIVRITRSEPVTFASLAAASTARLAPGEPSVATMMRGIALALLPQNFSFSDVAIEGAVSSSRQDAYFLLISFKICL